MALDFKNIDLLSDQGIELIDPYAVKQTKLTMLEDAMFDDANTLITRGGTSSVSLTALSGSSAVSGPRRMSKWKGNAIIEADSGMHVVNSLGTRQIQGANGSQFSRASLNVSPVANMPIYSGAAGVPGELSFDCVAIKGSNNSNYSVWAWHEYASSTGYSSVRYQVVDESKRSVLYERVLQGAAASFYGMPRLVAGPSNTVYLFTVNYDSGTGNFSLISTVINVLSPTTVSDNTITGFTPGASGVERWVFDAMWDSSLAAVVMVYRSTANNITFAKLTGGTSIALSKTIAATVSPAYLSLFSTYDGTTRRFHAIFTNAAGEASIRACGTDSTFTATVAEAVLGTATGGTPRVGRAVGFDPNPGSTGNAYVYYDASSTAIPSPLTPAMTIRCATVNKTGGAYTPSDFAAFQTGIIYGKPFQALGKRWVLPVAYPSTVEPSVLVLDITGPDAVTPTPGTYGSTYAHTLARLAQGNAGHIAYSWRLQTRIPQSAQPSNSDYFVVPYCAWGNSAGATMGATQTFYNNANYAQNLMRAELDLSTSQLSCVEVNGVSYLSGACPQLFDGKNFFEQGFSNAPTISVVASGAGGNLAAGAYGFTATFAYRDNMGNWHESAPAAPVSVTAVAGNSYTPTTTGLFTNKPNVQVVIYRTKVNDASGIYYRDSGVTGALSAGLTDANLGNSPVLPMTFPTAYSASTGRLMNDPFPPHRQCVIHQKRLWFFGCDEGFTLRWSQPFYTDYAVEGSNAFYRQLPREAGRLVGGASIDESLVALTEKRIGVFVGQAPDPTGGSDGLSEFVSRVNDYGCVWESPMSITRTDSGVWFSTAYGLRLLGRDLQIRKDDQGLDYGSEVDDLIRPLGGAGDRVVRVLVQETKQLVRFYMTSGVVYVYDTYWDQWSRFTNHASVDSVLVPSMAGATSSDLLHITSSGVLVKYDESVNTDTVGGAKVKASIKTAWIKLAGLDGFQRITHISGLSQCPDATAGSLNLTVGYSFDYSDTNTVNGVTATIPAETTYLGGSVHRWEHQLWKQSCTAIRFYITVQHAGTGRVRLTATSFRVGVKASRAKVATTQKV